MVAVQTDALAPAGGEAGRWRTRLADAPTWMLEDELARRHEAALGLSAIAIGDDFLVDPVASLVRWRGDAHQVTGRRMEIVYALAVAWMQGRKRLRTRTLAQMVWRGWDVDEARQNLSVTARWLRTTFSDLLTTTRVVNGGSYTTYYLMIDPAIPGRWVGGDRPRRPGAAP